MAISILPSLFDENGVSASSVQAQSVLSKRYFYVDLSLCR